MRNQNLTGKRKGCIGLGVMLALGAAVAFGSDPLYQAIDSSLRPKTDLSGAYAGNTDSGEASCQWKDGVYTYQSPEADQNGFKDQVEMTIEGNVITGLVWDCVKEDGTKKSRLSMDGKYVMTEHGLKWHEQAEAAAGYVLENQGVEGLISADGYATDAVASVSINLNGFVNGVKDCLKQAM